MPVGRGISPVATALIIRHRQQVRAIVSAMLFVGGLATSGCGRGPFWKFPVAERQRCSAVDFLFVIDNSESMEEHQLNLRSSFDPFIDGIRDSLDDVDDFHVGVVTTDRYWDNAEGCQHLGALVTSTDGPGSQRTECGPFAEGNRYMTEEDDLVESFNCTANVGIEGNPEEQPMKAMSEAISNVSPWSWECNRDFIRDEGLLVTVLITDEADGERTPGATRRPSTPDDWFHTVETVKGTEQNAVMVSLLNGVTEECPVQNPAFDGTEIANFTRMFTHGFVGGICEPDYGDLFALAVDEIDVACTEHMVMESGPRP